MGREANIQKAKEVREAFREDAREYVDATHIEVGEITGTDNTKKLLTILVADAHRYVPYQGHDDSEFTVGHFWAVVFDDLGTIRLAWWVSDAAGGGTRPVTPHDIDGAWHTDFLTIAQTWRWIGDNVVSFRDPQIYIHSSADGVFHIEADTSITFGANLFPDAANVLNVGDPGAEIHELYMGDYGPIYWRLDQSVNLYSDAAGRLRTDNNFWAYDGLAVGENAVFAATRLVDIDGVTTGFGAVLTPSMAITSPLFYGLFARLETAAAVITVTDAIALYVDDPVKGAGSTITNNYGLCIEDLTVGSARNWALCIHGDDPIVWGEDTLITRFAANVLYTPDDFHCAQEVRTGNGLVGTPAHSFISDVDLGMYRIGVNDLGFTTNSTLALELNASQQALVTVGTVAAPGLGFISDPDTGLYRLGANRLGFATNGTFAVEIDATQRVSIGTTVPLTTAHIEGTSLIVTSEVGNLFVKASDYGQNKGGMIAFGGEFRSDLVSYAGFANIAGRKESAVDTEFGSYLAFATRAHGGVLTEHMRLNSVGALSVTGCVTDGTCEIMSKRDGIAIIADILTMGDGAIDEHGHEHMDMAKIWQKYPFLIHKREDSYFDKLGSKSDLLYVAMIQLKEWVERLEAQIPA